MRKLDDVLIKKKALIISHDDLDGAGCVIVGKRFFKEVDYYKSNLYDLDSIIRKLLDSRTFDNYDLIFFTDLCPSNESIKELCKRGNTKVLNKLTIIDHHESNINRVNKNLEEFPSKLKDHLYLSVNDEEDGELTCGTKLFLDYLLEYTPLKLTRGDAYFKKLIKAIRYWDTFLWTKYDYKRAVELNFIFKDSKYDVFIRDVFTECKKGYEFEEEPFTFFNESEKKCIENHWDEVDDALDRATLCERMLICSDDKFFQKYFVDKESTNKDILKFFKKEKIRGLRVLLCATINPKYISLMSHFLFKSFEKCDIIIFVDLEYLSFSYRARSNSGVRVNGIAELFNGGGHKLSSGSPIFDTSMNEISVNQSYFLLPNDKYNNTIIEEKYYPM